MKKIVNELKSTTEEKIWDLLKKERKTIENLKSVLSAKLKDVKQNDNK
jgi:hypothetical protein